MPLDDTFASRHALSPGDTKNFVSSSDTQSFNDKDAFSRQPTDKILPPSQEYMEIQITKDDN